MREFYKVVAGIAAVLLLALPILAASTYTDHGDGTATVEGGVAGITVTVTGPIQQIDYLVEVLSWSTNRQATVLCVEGEDTRDDSRMLTGAGSTVHGCTPGEEIANPQPKHDAAMIGLKLLVEQAGTRYNRSVQEQSLSDPTLDLDQ